MGPPNFPGQAQPPPPVSLRKLPSGEYLPATPLASVGPPNFSYGSATHALPRRISLADTKMGIFAAMKNAATEARERDLRLGKVVEPEEEGQSPLVRFYTEPVEEVTVAVQPPKIEALKDEVPRRSSRRNMVKKGGREESVDSVEFRRTPTPTSEDDGILLGLCGLI